MKKPGRKAQPPNARSIKTRAKLKAAARRILEREGYANLRISGIAEEAGVSIGLFYHYYDDLVEVTYEVLGELLEQVQSDTIEAGRKAVSEDGDNFDLIYQQALVIAGHYEKSLNLMHCLFEVQHDLPEISKLWQQVNAEYNDRFARTVERSLSRPSPDHDFILVAVSTVGYLVDSLFNDYYIHRDEHLRRLISSREELAELAATFMYRALFLANPPAEKLKFTKPALQMHK